MAFEVEIKAHVRDPEALTALLEGRYGRGQAFHKSDAYFIEREPAAGVAGLSGAARSLHKNDDPAFRLRSERCGGKSVCLVTAKKKSMQGGVEVNEEIEFSIEDPRAFRAFTAMLGYGVFLEKGKAGHVWEIETHVKIELAEVNGLGHFIEIEELTEDESAVPGARARVQELMEGFGFTEQDIEPRYYTEMLLEQGVGGEV